TSRACRGSVFTRATSRIRRSTSSRRSRSGFEARCEHVGATGTGFGNTMTPVDQNFFAYLHHRLVERADDELLATSDGTSFTYGDIDRISARIAACLRDAGVDVGDRVSVQAGKSRQSLCLSLPCLRAGFVFHPINPAYKSNELETLLRHAEPSAVVCDPCNERAVAALAAAAGARVVLTLGADGCGSLIDRAAGASERFATVRR